MATSIIMKIKMFINTDNLLRKSVIWSHSVSFGVFGHLGSFGVICDHWGIIQGHLGLFGAIRDHSGPYCAI